MKREIFIQIIFRIWIQEEKTLTTYFGVTRTKLHPKKDLKFLINLYLKESVVFLMELITISSLNMFIQLLTLFSNLTKIQWTKLILEDSWK